MKEKRDRLSELCVEIKRYNKIHNTHLSYGEYTTLIRSGKIVSEMWGSGKRGGKKNERNII